MDKHLLKSNPPILKRSISRIVVLNLAIILTFVTLFIGIATYLYNMEATKELVLDQLLKYIGERGLRESAIFLDSEAYQLRFQNEYIERYNRIDDKEVEIWFDEHLEKRHEDGTYRSKPELYYGKNRELGRRDLSASMMIGADTDITTGTLKALAIGYDMINQYGPAWRKPFVDLYFSSPEKTSVSRWPGTPWGLIMDDDVDWREEEWFAITTNKNNPERLQKWSGVLYDERNGNWMVSGVTPLDIDGKQVGMVGTDLLLDDLINRTIDETLSGAYNIILQADGRIISHTYLMDQIIANRGILTVQSSDDIHLQHIFEHLKTTTTYPAVYDHKETNEFLAISQIKGPDWYFILVYPKTLLRKQAMQNVGFIILAGIISFIIMFLVIWFMLKRNLVSPLNLLTKTVKDFKLPYRYSTGKYNKYDIYTSKLAGRPDEIGLLAGSFIDLSEHLFTSYKELDMSKMDLEASLKEKELLIRELYHRTKNNMQVISSMLSIQSAYSQNDSVKEVFQETNNRIMAMSLVHKKLYQTKNLANLYLNEYINDLLELLKKSLGEKTILVEIVTEMDEIVTTIDTAVPCGLILNELFTNSIKYAFPDDRNGKIVIKLTLKDDNEILFKITDNGIGIPKSVNIRKDRKYGLQSVIAIVEHQLSGGIDFTVNDGTEIVIRFFNKVTIGRL